MDYQIITNPEGKVIAVLMYCTLDLAMRTAAEYRRVLGVTIYRNTLRFTNPESVPRVGSYLPELRRATEGGF